MHVYVCERETVFGACVGWVGCLDDPIAGILKAAFDEQ